MPRYEGMDDLLQRVRERLGVVDRDLEQIGDSSEAEQGEYYASALEALLLLMRDAEKLHERLESRQAQSLTPERHDELMALLGKVLRELWQCKAALERHPASAGGTSVPGPAEDTRVAD